jgi:lipoprotein-anchoring transpeptidase ErfK/SrfK
VKAPLLVAFAAAISFSVSVRAQPALNVAALDAGYPDFGQNTLAAVVDLSDQKMRVYVDDALLYTWNVSTGLGYYATPTGQWNAYWLSPHHRSSLYGGAPMPWSVFFNGNYAVHGTNAVAYLGQPASHGCVRLSPEHAEIFFHLVEEHGLSYSLVAVVD